MPFVRVYLCCLRGRNYTIISRNCIRNIFLAPKKPSIKKFFALLLAYFWYKINESTQLFTICDAWHDPDKWIIQEWIYWEQSSSYGSIIFPKHNIVCWIMLRG